ncbi:MAG: redoxin domain-containing protein [Candidatus Zambryskibacteria bacterium]
MKKIKELLPFLSILLFVIGVGALGFGLYKTAPSQTAQSETNNAAANGASDHHGGAGAEADYDVLNSLVDNPLPEISLKDKDGKIYTATDLKDKYTVLFFNEGLMCYPACWNQIVAFGDDERFNSNEVQAISVVVDSAADWQKAIDKMPKLAAAKTMFDVGANSSKALGMLTTSSSMHRGSLPGHTYVIVDKEGIVRFVYDDPTMRIANDMMWNKINDLD